MSDAADQRVYDAVSLLAAKGHQISLDQRLTGGTLNQVWRVHYAGDYAVLRVQTSDMVNEVIKAREFAITRLAAEAGIAPKLYAICPTEGVLLMQYIASVDKPADLADRIVLMTKLHQLPISNQLAQGPSMRAMLQGYLERLASKIGTTFLAQYDQQYALLNGCPQALCHLDPWLPNVLDDGEQAYLIDFEYSAVEYAIIDYAMLATTVDDDGLVWQNQPFTQSQIQAAFCLAAIVEHAWYLSAQDCSLDAYKEKAQQRYQRLLGSS